MTRVPRPRDFVDPGELDARIERQWDALERAGLPTSDAGASRARGTLALGFGFATAGALAAFCVVWLGVLHPRVAPPSGALVESVEREITVKLEDGSQLALAERTQLELLRNEPNAIELSLRTGRAHFDVTHRHGRSFRIEAGACEVRVIGTRFVLEQHVRGAGKLVRVAVEAGVVEVRRKDVASGEVRRLHAGESWSAVIEPVVATPAKTAPASSAVAGEVPAAAAKPEAEATKPEAEAAKPEAELEHAAAPVPAAQAANARERPRTREPAPVRLDAAGLFQRATLSRRAGRMRDAADEYAALLVQHPNDTRAGLAAFELGRIRMDALADPEGAIEVLARAASGPAHTSFHEDALARIVLANDALGRHDSCIRARERYLASYPQGVHARTLQCK